MLFLFCFKSLNICTSCLSIACCSSCCVVCSMNPHEAHCNVGATLCSNYNNHSSPSYYSSLIWSGRTSSFWWFMCNASIDWLFSNCVIHSNYVLAFPTCQLWLYPITSVNYSLLKKETKNFNWLGLEVESTYKGLLLKVEVLLPWPGWGILSQQSALLQRVSGQLHHTPNNVLLFCQNKPTDGAGNQSHLEVTQKPAHAWWENLHKLSPGTESVMTKPWRALSRIRMAMVIKVQHLEQMSAALKLQFYSVMWAMKRSGYSD